jgi:hypothetical protein
MKEQSKIRNFIYPFVKYIFLAIYLLVQLLSKIVKFVWVCVAWPFILIGKSIVAIMEMYDKFYDECVSEVSDVCITDTVVWKDGEIVPVQYFRNEINNALEIMKIDPNKALVEVYCRHEKIISSEVPKTSTPEDVEYTLEYRDGGLLKLHPIRYLFDRCPTTLHFDKTTKNAIIFVEDTHSYSRVAIAPYPFNKFERANYSLKPGSITKVSGKITRLDIHMGNAVVIRIGEKK